MNYGMLNWPVGDNRAHDGIPLARRVPDGSINPIKFYGYFTKAFPVYRCLIVGLSPASGAGNVYLRCSKDGSTPDSAANYYDGALGGAMANSSQIDMSAGTGLADPNECSGEIIIWDPLNVRGGLWKWIRTTLLFNNSGGTPTSIIRGGGYYNQASPIRGIEISYAVGGAFRSGIGEVILYGVKAPHAYF